MTRNYRARTPRSFRPTLSHEDRTHVQITVSAMPMHCTPTRPIGLKHVRGTRIFERPLRAFMPRQLVTV